MINVMLMVNAALLGVIGLMYTLIGMNVQSRVFGLLQLAAAAATVYNFMV